MFYKEDKKVKWDNIKLRNFKMIVSDIDGTLMGKSKQIEPFTHNIINRLREKGFYFTLATGKNLPATVPQADALEIDLPLILINGAMLQMRWGKILKQTVLPLEVIKQVVKICEKYKKDLVIYINNGIYFTEMNKNIRKVYGHVKTDLNEIRDWSSLGKAIAGANKCLVVDTNHPENLSQIGRVFRDAFNEHADVVHGSRFLLEVMPKGVTKATGIRALSKSLGVKMSEVMAFGDFDNDAEMLSAVGLGIAVENASARAKSAANFVIGSVEEQGLAVFLNELLDRQLDKN